MCLGGGADHGAGFVFPFIRVDVLLGVGAAAPVKKEAYLAAGTLHHLHLLFAGLGHRGGVTARLRGRQRKVVHVEIAPVVPDLNHVDSPRQAHVAHFHHGKGG